MNGGVCWCVASQVAHYNGTVHTCKCTLQRAMEQYAAQLLEIEKFGVEMQLPKRFWAQLKDVQAACCFPHSVSLPCEP